MEAEGAVVHIIEKLNIENIRQAVFKRYIQRRNQEEVSLLLTLHKGEYPVSENYLAYSSKAVIKETASK